MISLAYKNDPILSSEARFLASLKIVSQYPFPAPSEVRKVYNRKNSFFDITAFTDKKLLKALTPKTRVNTHLTLVDNNSIEHLGLLVAQSDTTGITISNESSFLTWFQIRSLFQELVHCECFWLSAACYAFSSDIYVNNFTYDDHMQKTILAWLQYFGKAELEKRGGFAAFESNPYLQTERVHDGLFVQVGDDPAIFDTPEGATLLVNAVNALPLVQH